MIPAKYEAAVSPARALKAENFIRRTMKFSPKTKISFQNLGHPGLQAHAKSAGMGRGRGEIVLNTHRDPSVPARAVLAHERAHLAPKRNSVRFGERITDPERLGREEGRADYLSGRSGNYETPFKGSKKKDREKAEAFNRGYTMVQRRMTRAGTKTQLNKRLSAFGVIW